MSALSYSTVAVFFGVLICVACTITQEELLIQGYSLNEADEHFELPKSLREVSGAAYWKNDKLALVQDEEDIVYIYNTKKKEVVDKVKFHKEGDHEGIASDGSQLYVLRSDGHLFQLEDLKGKKTDSKNWNNELSAANDAEGLCYDLQKKKFLIACKGKPGKGLSGKTHRAVWAFSPKKGKLGRKPELLVEKAAINAMLSERAGRTVKREFAPSAIEVHPVTGHIWMVSARGNVLVVYDRKGVLLDAVVLPAGRFIQPEALTFAPNGDLYIANEGGKGRAVMYRFSQVVAKE